ncbi:rhodanese-like domain-containing protein [Tahibacter amnicola]|uniref:Rhodanese-like domain-containing protein n=1 Tax=Tahibacter amnicola TaxID=2976241 RepID=A0ABY6BCI2_9GAMM|nr:rhodanese-like domain-containing protein [Tahibacter amnicola]UXI66326.1 rhodanese-like domain-containing protein [Tahibacter amnicola]
MNVHTMLVSLGLLLGAAMATAGEPAKSLHNPAIDMDGYLAVSAEAAKHRASRRVSEADFLRMSREPGTIVLDARSREKYDMLHVRGAINLSFPDIDVASLEQALPDKNARILVYCNNNFTPVDAFPRKMATASLNLSTYISLYTYGYRNVYELAPLIDLDQSILPFESASGAARSARAGGGEPRKIAKVLPEPSR